MNSVLCRAQKSGVQSVDVPATSGAFHLADIVKSKTEVSAYYSICLLTSLLTRLSTQDLAKAVWGSLFKAMK